jgi:hypothetical protein
MGLALALTQLLLVAATADDTFVDAISRARTLYRTENFAMLDKAFEEARRDDERYSSGDPKLHALYWTLRFQLPAPGVDPSEGARIGRWQAHSPHSPLAYFASCRYFYAIAWNARGTEPLKDLDEANLKRFAERLRRAETCLINAPAALKDTPLWYHLMIAVSQDLVTPNYSPDKLLDEAAGKWPQYYGVYEVRLSRLGPYFGGSWQAVDDFISKWSSRQSALDGDTLYARLYFAAQRDDIPAAEIERRWPRLRASFRELIARYPDPDFKNRFASYACRLHDTDTLTVALRAIRTDELDPAMWMRDAPYETCSRQINGVRDELTHPGGGLALAGHHP